MTVFRLALTALLAALLAGCGQSMTDQPRYDTYEAASAFADGSSARLPPAGTVPQSWAGHANDDEPPTATSALLQHGREQYEIYCTPCHGLAGYGDGMVVQRGFPAPPSYHDERLLDAPASHYYDVITKGYGVMYSYAERIPPKERWAIVAYIRALQLSQNATARIAADQGVELP